jgi:hypothetical protein
MRVAVCFLVVLATACGSAAPGARMERYGISLEVPAGWDGEVSRGLIRIARGDVSVVLYEYETDSAAAAAYFKDDWPVRLEAADFGRRPPGDENTRSVSVAGRLYSVFTEGAGAPSAEELEELYEALASFEVEVGDFYPGAVQPVVFPQRPGWHVVSSGPSPRYAYGEFAHTAAATIPYRNDPPDLPPVRTLEALPRDGILVWVGVQRDARVPPSRVERATAFERRRPPPYRIADLERVDGWEGQVRDIPDYRLWALTGDRYLVDLRIYFGRARPTEAMLAEADALLRGLRFPDWGPWELEDA